MILVYAHENEDEISSHMYSNRYPGRYTVLSWRINSIVFLNY